MLGLSFFSGASFLFGGTLHILIEQEEYSALLRINSFVRVTRALFRRWVDTSLNIFTSVPVIEPPSYVKEIY